MEVTVPSYMQPADGAILFPVKISDVVATMKGSGDPKRVYVISGHLDSRVTDLNNYTADAPGADDEYGYPIFLSLISCKTRNANA